MIKIINRTYVIIHCCCYVAPIIILYKVWIFFCTTLQVLLQQQVSSYKTEEKLKTKVYAIFLPKMILYIIHIICVLYIYIYKSVFSIYYYISTTFLLLQFLLLHRLTVSLGLWFSFNFLLAMCYLCFLLPHIACTTDDTWLFCN